MQSNVRSLCAHNHTLSCVFVMRVIKEEEDTSMNIKGYVFLYLISEQALKGHGLSHCDNDPFKKSNILSLQPPCAHFSLVKSKLLTGFFIFTFYTLYQQSF